MRCLTIALVILLLMPCSSWAQLKDENLLQSLPTGYKIDFQERKNNILITEMVPQKESVNNWTEMVTTQVFLGLKNASPENFQSFMKKQWIESCKGGSSTSVSSGKENGYQIALWLMTCPLNESTGKPEYTWVKAIKGNDSFYVVQKAFKFNPSKEQISQWMQYLKKVKVCDTRLPDRACPKIDN